MYKNNYIINIYNLHINLIIKLIYFIFWKILVKKIWYILIFVDKLK